MNKIILISVLLIVIIFGGLAGSFLYTNTQNENLRSKLYMMERELVDIKSNLGQTSRTQSELAAQVSKQNEQVAPEKQKSQDEILTTTVAAASPAVVSIVVSKDVPQLEIVYENPFGNDPRYKDVEIRIPVVKQKGTEQKRVGAGTGFIVTSTGYILTNKHVVSDSSATYTVLLNDGSKKNASLIYKDPRVDVALIKIEGTGHKTIKLGDSGAAKLGQTVIAIGNALGQYNNSISVGIISGLNRTIEIGSEKLTGIIQTDAAINSGNSGGPLLDLEGKAIGINVARVVGSSNIGFAVPINIAKEIVGGIITLP